MKFDFYGDNKCFKTFNNRTCSLFLGQFSESSEVENCLILKEIQNFRKKAFQTVARTL